MKRGYRLLGRHSHSVDVDLAPERVHALVADIVNTPQYSPEVQRVEWIAPHDHPAEGARLRGQNRRRPFPRWWRDVEIIVAVPGRLFCFETVPGRGPYNDITVWTYGFEPIPTGTRVSQTAELYGPRLIGVLDRLTGGGRAMDRNIKRSLENLKTLAERGT